MWRNRGNNNNDPYGLSNGMCMFLKIGDVIGSGPQMQQSSSQFDGWIPILAWSWGLSKGGISEAQRPLRVREAIVTKKKDLLKKKGIDVDEDIEEKAGNAEDEERSMRRRRAKAPFEISKTEKISAVLAQEGFDSDNAEDNQFRDDEVVPAHVASKPQIQGLSITKYVDIASPQLMMNILSAKKGVEASLVICKERVMEQNDGKEEGSDEEKEKDGPSKESVDSLDAFESSSSSTSKKTSKKKKAVVSSSSSSSKKRTVEYLPFMEYSFNDVFVTSLSTGGSGGQDRLTENIMLEFSSFQFRFNGTFDFYRTKVGMGEDGDDNNDEDEKKAEAKSNKSKSLREVMPADPNIRSASLIYDKIRNRAQKLDEFIEGHLKQREELKDVRGMVMEYL